ncbi:hypothetical protein [Alicyclobacillus macrosporangiidus]|uniref:hypothetical protein n=1 Tax=Alicyclobacillus macrosporangiidus TaxID=392015 RepID=UPI0034E95191
MKVITLCGSVRFRKQFEEWNEKLTLEGNVVISVEGFSTNLTDEQKKLLELIHMKKIDMADDIFVIMLTGTSVKVYLKRSSMLLRAENLCDICLK